MSANPRHRAFLVFVAAALLAVLVVGPAQANTRFIRHDSFLLLDHSSSYPIFPGGAATSWTAQDSASGTDDRGFAYSESASISWTETYSGGKYTGVTFSSNVNAFAEDGTIAVARTRYSVRVEVASVPYTLSGSVENANDRAGGVHVFLQRMSPLPVETIFFLVESGVTAPRAVSLSGTLQPGIYVFQAEVGAEGGNSISGAYHLDFVFALGAAPTTVSIGDAATLEGAPGAGNALSFPVSLSAPAPAGGVTVSYGTADGTAQAGSDYNVNTGTLTFAAGEQQKLVTVQVVGDAANEPDETVFVTLSNPSGATLARPTGTGMIINDDHLVDFDWTVPDRFGLDDDGDSLIDYFTTAASISPATWRVDFVYTSGGLCDPALSPSLTIDGVVIAAGNPAIVARNAALCKISYAFPAEKKYAVKLELRNGAGATLGQVLKDVIVQDWLIVSLGDSVASGEGNPDFPRVTVGDTPVWQDRQCHRTAFAGPAQAALALERADPKTSVTFVHLACSGASIYEGILTRYRGQEPGPWGAGWIPPQVEVMDALVGTREIDAVTVSTGANDVRFARVVTGCFWQRDCHLATTPNSMLQYFNLWLAFLPSAYDRLALTLRQPRYDVTPARTYITEYFDALRDQNGAFCDETILEELFQFPGRGISAAESQWASTDMMVRLNQQVSAHAGRAGWKYVGGIYAPFRTHGYCSTDRWIVQLTESLLGQGNVDGTIHPNRLGHALYGQRIANSLTADFYPVAGDLSKPRPPR